ncbi:Na(+)-translocating NADH-quinone reductase subunit E [Mergibacter septicus]|uniref:(Na+)-NQR maturation NqrM n=1 Tax=Mergibacter septicus TaxID=221402 RepID=UPI0011798600|nr:(Na+)-NQR maturation NqrM [Mergibacter septicus]AWX14085.1 Na(+)-translocating NADH-quinone reductase subunit E [Mergibacter septicus]
MRVFLFTFGFFLLIILAMAVGYIIKRKTISGSCGGISSLGLEKVCDCPEPCDKRKAKMVEEATRQARFQQSERIL